MKQILFFFIPRATKEIVQWYLFFHIGALLMIILGIDILSIPGMGGLLIFLGLPIVSYFNSRSYLGSHLNWLLLTPIKKSRIIYANAVLNVFKFCIIYCLSAFTWWFYYSEDSFVDFAKEVFFLRTGGSYTHSPVYLSLDIVLLIWTIFTLFYFLAFSILSPLVLTTTGEKQSFVASLKNVRIVLASILILLMVFSLTYFSDSLAPFFPRPVITALFLSFFILCGLGSTLAVTKIYYTKKLIPLFMGIPFILILITIIINVQLSFKYNRSNMDDLLSDYSDIGFYAKFYRDDVKSRLVGNSSDIKILRQKHLDKMFGDNKNNEVFSDVSSNWSSRCLKGDAVPCRLEGYLASVKGGRTSIESFRKSCPDDVVGCYELYSHISATPKDIELSEKYLQESCSDDEQNVMTLGRTNRDGICCSCWQNQKIRKLRNSKTSEAKKDAKKQRN